MVVHLHLHRVLPVAGAHLRVDHRHARPVTDSTYHALSAAVLLVNVGRGLLLADLVLLAEAVELLLEVHRVPVGVQRLDHVAMALSKSHNPLHDHDLVTSGARRHSERVGRADVQPNRGVGVALQRVLGHRHRIHGDLLHRSHGRTVTRTRGGDVASVHLAPQAGVAQPQRHLLDGLVRGPGSQHSVVLEQLLDLLLAEVAEALVKSLLVVHRTGASGAKQPERTAHLASVGRSEGLVGRRRRLSGRCECLRGRLGGPVRLVQIVGSQVP